MWGRDKQQQSKDTSNFQATEELAPRNQLLIWKQV